MSGNQTCPATEAAKKQQQQRKEYDRNRTMMVTEASIAESQARIVENQARIAESEARKAESQERVVAMQCLASIAESQNETLRQTFQHQIRAQKQTFEGQNNAFVQVSSPPLSRSRVSTNTDETSQQSQAGKEEEGDDEVVLMDPPDRKVTVLEIDDDDDENGKVNAVECIMTPAKKPGDLAVFTPVKSSARAAAANANENPGRQDATVAFLKARCMDKDEQIYALQNANYALKQDKRNLEHDKRNLELSNNVLKEDKIKLEFTNDLLRSRLADYPSGPPRKRRRRFF